MQDAIKRKEYYIKNKEKWKKYYFSNLSDEEKQIKLDYQKEYRNKNRSIITEKTRLKRKNRLLKAIEELGGCCSKCKNIFDPCIYDFHHLNPKEKEFTISDNMLISESKLFSEIKKCILLCANCHRLVHKKEFHDN